MALRLITPPASEPVTLEDLKLHCRIDSSDEDATLAIYLAAARTLIEQESGRALLPQTWRLTLTTDPPDEIKLPACPFRSVTSVSYVDSFGNTQSLTGSDYRIDSATEPARLMPLYADTWPVVRTGPSAFVVTFSAGYDNAASIPAPLRNAVMLLAAHLFEHRLPVVTGTIVAQLPFSVKALVDPYRVELFR